MERFFLITNNEKDVDLQITKSIYEFITSLGKTCETSEMDSSGFILVDTIPEHVDCCLVIGGDGTLIRAARDLENRDIPLLGVNLGTLGYLTEIEVDEVQSAILALIDDNYTIENRMMLAGYVNDGEPTRALNDIIIARDGYLRTVHFDVYVNDVKLNRYHADGVVIATPTGSTGYNLSAGGPIVEPSAKNILITPVCPHGFNTGSIVLSAEDKIKVQIIKDRYGHKEHAAVAYDGSNMKTLETGDTVYIEKAEQVTKMIRIHKESFMYTLRKKFRTT